MEYDKYCNTPRAQFDDSEHQTRFYCRYRCLNMNAIRNNTRDIFSIFHDGYC
jgi:hypothetical protein